MSEKLTRRGVLQLGAMGAAGLSALNLFPNGVTAANAATAKKFKIALANSFIGNKWRIEMENVWKSRSQMEPFKSAGRRLVVQLGQRRQQAVAADLQSDRARRSTPSSSTRLLRRVSTAS